MSDPNSAPPATKPSARGESAPPEHGISKPSARGGHAVFVAAGIFLSRIAGLVRERAIAHYLGNSAASDAFKAALKVPNFLQNLLGEGVLSASFIPVYAKLIAEKKEEEARRVAGAFAAILSMIVSAAVLIGVLLTPWLIDFIAPGFHGATRLLTIRIVRILFPGIGLLVLYAWCLGVLNTHKQFFVSYVAPVLWNASMIATLLVFGTRMREADLAIALSWGHVIGCALQLMVQVPFIWKYAREFPFKPRLIAPVREVFRNLGPVIVGRGVVQLSAYIDQIIASLLPTGSVASLSYAQTISLLPVSLFGMSVAAAELPQMASNVGTVEEINAALRKRLARGLRQIAFFVVPTVVAFIAIGRLLVAGLYQTGKFTSDDTLYVWYILLGSTIGLLAMTLGRLYSSAFYALRDTKTPLYYAAARVALTAGLGYLFAFPLNFLFVDLIHLLGMPLPVRAGAAGIGTVGLTASAGIAGWLEFLLLRRGLQRRIGPIDLPMSFPARLWASATVAGLAAFALDRYAVSRFIARVPFTHIAEAALAAGFFGVVYFAAAGALGVPEVRSTLARLKR
ncbi:MAG TPA: murein biosynthesis integral membrane protein MurJ [Thermoanaerobaculia bacterium]|nr:murein biosynthesis integral membrane protein MurJ [Thermoanaerobaculia bacterium]